MKQLTAAVLVLVLIGTAHAQVKVNNSTLTRLEADRLRLITKEVVPNLPGGPDQRVNTAAYATWWSLREGFMALPNPHLTSRCASKSAGKDVALGPLEECERGVAWQVGLAAVQVYTPPKYAKAQADRVQSIIAASWGKAGKPQADILREAATFAGVPERATEIAALPPGPLRTSWLLRHPVIGIAVVAEQEVVPECFSPKATPKQLGDCFGGKGDNPNRFAPDKAGGDRAIADLKRLLATP